MAPPIAFATQDRIATGRRIRMAAAIDAMTILAWGDPGRGDESVGPMLADRISMLSKAGLAVIEATQLDSALATRIQPSVPVLFLSASSAIEHGFVVEKLAPHSEPGTSSQALSPAGLLDLYEATTGLAAPPAYQLHIAGFSFEPGESLSDETSLAADAAWRFLRRLLAQSGDSWQATLDAASVDAVPGDR